MAEPTAALLALVEDACLNASAPPQQRWLDGWLLRFQPGKARRARCIHAMAPGCLPLATRLEQAAALYRDAGLPLIFRITPFTQPPDLDATLADLGFAAVDPTQVLLRTGQPAPTARPLPAGVHWQELGHEAFADAVGELRQSPPAHRQAHGQRLRQAPVRHQGVVIQRDADGRILCCGQMAIDGMLVGLYDLATHPDERGKSWATRLCERLLAVAALQGAELAYLQVDVENAPAVAVYRRLGFGEGYRYHYRAAAT